MFIPSMAPMLPPIAATDKREDSLILRFLVTLLRLSAPYIINAQILIAVIYAINHFTERKLC